jgi:hypothetical protein
MCNVVHVSHFATKPYLIAIEVTAHKVIEFFITGNRLINGQAVGEDTRTAHAGLFGKSTLIKIDGVTKGKIVQSRQRLTITARDA